VTERDPVHVTMKLRKGLTSLRRRRETHALFDVFARTCDLPGFRVVHFSVQSNHMHLIVEAKDQETLSAEMHRLAIRIALRLNRLWQRTGRVFADRYHAHVLRTLREVRNALLYVLQNARRHRVRIRGWIDRCSSAVWSDGWRDRLSFESLRGALRPVADARSWKLVKGWRRCGLLWVHETPGPPA
jgi:REP element-mobilizing transposase RayT